MGCKDFEMHLHSAVHLLEQIWQVNNTFNETTMVDELDLPLPFK